ncbi:MAG: coproporphyrinogen dehydrogenase HemZ [Eubacteriales bacterium]|nr:coproporphyrinogen dehydrogenase HemZ [Eubacteriales bacterium]
MNKWGILSGIRPVKLIREMIVGGEVDPVSTFIATYDVTKEKADLAYDIAIRELKVMDGIGDNDIGLYIGIPFCRSRCAYCSFITDACVNHTELFEPYVEKLKLEIAYSKDIIEKAGFNVVSAYMGGGTPTAIPAQLIDEILKEINGLFPNIREFTVEAGRADTITYDKLATIKNNGINRICINPQTLNDSILKSIGRLHTAEDFVNSYKMAREMGFEHINTDLIAGLPHDTITSFKTSLDKVLSLDPSSITVHTLSIKRGSGIHEKPQQFPLPSSKVVNEMIEYSYNVLTTNGYNPYYLYRQKNQLGNLENIGYAKDGYESIYNIMMMEETSTIISLGAGGVSKTVNNNEKTINRVFNFKEPHNYIEGIDEILGRKDELLKKY